MSFPPIRTASRAFFSLDGNRILPYNKFVNKQFVLFYCMIECLERQWIIPFACLLQNIFRDLYGRSCNGSTPTKTRTAIFSAFSTLLAKKATAKITVQDIIDVANVGRTTFYAHFETKDDLLKALCEELFGHIISTAMDCTHTHGLYSNQNVPESVFCHLLQHLQENDRNIIGLLSCESSEIFFTVFQRQSE